MPPDIVTVRWAPFANSPMKIRIKEALTAGISHTIQRAGILLVAGCLLATLGQIGFESLLSGTVVPLGGAPTSETTGLLEPGTQIPSQISLQVEVVVFLASILIASPIIVVANRTFVSGFTDGIPAKFYFHKLGRAAIRTTFAALVLAILLLVAAVLCFGLIGLVSLGVFAMTGLEHVFSLYSTDVLLSVALFVSLLPGAYLISRFMFFEQEIAVKDANVTTALINSWRLTRQSRLILFTLALLAYFPLLLLWFAMEFSTSPVVHLILTVILAVSQIAVLSVAARIYVQLDHAYHDPEQQSYEALDLHTDTDESAHSEVS